jgi:hypothetical protein
LFKISLRSFVSFVSNSLTLVSLFLDFFRVSQKKKTKFGSSSMLQSLPTAGTKPPAGSGVAKPLASSASTFVESAAVGSKRKASEPSSSVAAVAAPTYSSTTWGSAGATEAEAEADPIAEVLEDFDFDDLDVDEYLIGADEEEQVYGDGNQILALYESVSHDNKSKNAKKDADEVPKCYFLSL